MGLFRRLGRRRLSTAGAILTIALPAALNLAMFAVLDAAVLRPLPYPHSDRLFYLGSTGNNPTAALGPMFDVWRANSQTCDTFAGLQAYDRTFFSPTGAERIPAGRVTSSLFRLLGTRVALGRPFLPEDERADSPPVALLSHDFWRTRFGGDPAVLGKPIRLTVTVYTIVGVLPADFDFFADLLRQRPAVYLSVPNDWRRDLTAFHTIVRLKPGVSAAAAQSELWALAQPLARRYHEPADQLAFQPHPLLDAMNGGAGRLLWLLVAAGTITVAVACLNLASVFRLRVTEERRDLAIRAALGAGTGRLMRYALAQCTVLCGLGTLLGLALAAGGLRILTDIVPADLPLARLQHASIDLRVLGFAIAAGAVSLFFMALLPVFEVARTDLVALIRSGTEQPPRFRRVRPQHAVLTAQTAVATALVIATFFLLASYYRLASHPLGLDYARVLTVPLDIPRVPSHTDEQVRQFHLNLAHLMAGVPGVTATATTMFPPLTPLYRRPFDDADRPLTRTSAAPTAAFQRVSRNYFDMMRIPRLEGRFFGADEDCLATFPAVINQAMARTYWPGRSPLGHRVLPDYSKTPLTIIGVAGDTLEQVSQTQPAPIVYGCQPSDWSYLLVRTVGDPYRVAPVVARNARSIEPLVSIGRFESMEDMVAGSTARPRSQAILLAMFGLLSALMAVLGICAAVAEWVSRRNRELGIRISLGAGQRGLLSLVPRDAVAVGAIGAAAGLLLAAAGNRLLRSLVHGTEAVTPLAYGGVAAVFLGVILAAAWIPARRALAADPVVILRHE